VTVSSGDGREAVNFGRSCVWPSSINALSSRFLSAFHISTGSSIASVSGWSSSQHLRCNRTATSLARLCEVSCRGRRATSLPTGRSSTPVTAL